MYKEWVYTGGAFALGLTLPWMGVKMSTRTEQPAYSDLHTGFPTTPLGVLDKHYWELPVRDAVEHMGRHHPSWREWLSHATNDDWWKPMSIEDKNDRFTVPAFMIGGYYDPRYPMPTPGGHMCCPRVTNILTGPRNNINVQVRQDVLVYTSEVLAQDLEVTGPVIAKIFASSSARDTDWTVKLLDLIVRIFFFSEGILNPSPKGTFRASGSSNR